MIDETCLEGEDEHPGCKAELGFVAEPASKQTIYHDLPFPNGALRGAAPLSVWRKEVDSGPPAEITMSSTLSPTDYDSLEIQQQYNDINNRWELADEDWDNENSSARLFERSRIKALAGKEHLWLNFN
ncbi:UNVERIFIED_CONTAM: hypothetical protein K2H54_006963 [Gekko kuhli]